MSWGHVRARNHTFFGFRRPKLFGMWCPRHNSGTHVPNMVRQSKQRCKASIHDIDDNPPTTTDGSTTASTTAVESFEPSPKRQAAETVPASSVLVDPIRLCMVGPMLAIFHSGVAYPPLGKGTYGSVFRGFRAKQEPVAVKIVHLKHGMEDFKLPHTVREMVLLATASSRCATDECRHTMPVRSLDTFIDMDKTCCVAISMPLAGKSLAQVVADVHAKKIWLGRQSHRVLMRDVVHGAREVQSFFGGPGRGGHYDIKPQNIVVFRPTRSVPRVHLRTVDYGMARIIDQTDPMGIGILSSLWYRSPESLVLGNDVACWASSKHDVWSVGIVILEMALALGGSLSLLHGAQTEDAMIDTLVRLLGSPTSSEWEGIARAASVDPESPSAKRLSRFMSSGAGPVIRADVLPVTSVFHGDDDLLDLVTQCLRYCPDDRPSLEEVLAHPFFFDVEAVATDPLVVHELSTVLLNNYAKTPFPPSWDDTVSRCRKITTMSSYSECHEVASTVILPKLSEQAAVPVDARQRSVIASHLLTKAVCDVDMSLITVIGAEVVSRELFGTLRSLNVPQNVFAMACLVTASSLVDDSIQLRNAMGHQPTTPAPLDSDLVEVVKVLLHVAFIVGYRGLVARIVQCVQDIRCTVASDERSRGRESYAFVACINRLHVGEPYESFARVWDLSDEDRTRCMGPGNVAEANRLQTKFRDKLLLHGWVRDPHCCLDLLHESYQSLSNTDS